MKEPSLLIPIDCLLPSVGTFIATRYKKNQKPTENLSKTNLGAPLNLRFFASDASSGSFLFELSRRRFPHTQDALFQPQIGARPQDGGNLPRWKVWSPTKKPNSEGAGEIWNEIPMKWMFPKLGGKTPKMDGLFHGSKPY